MVQADATMNRLPAISRFAALCLLVIFVVCGGYGLNTLLAPHLIRAGVQVHHAPQCALAGPDGGKFRQRVSS